jgi:hypothetical protein
MGAVMDELGALTQQVAALRAEYERVGRPIMKQIIDTERRITDIKRERGELFYVEYMRYGTKQIEECDTLDDAKGFAFWTSEHGEGSIHRIYGPGVELKDEEWDE